MGMVVRTNMGAINANNALTRNNSTVNKNLEKLSSGMRINRAADDASGLAISEKMKAQIKALDTASANAEDGISLVQTSEGYMEEVQDMLNRIVELAEKSANGTYETKSIADGGADAEVFGNAETDRQALQDEVDQLTAEIDRIATTANFNNLKIMDGSLEGKFSDAQAEELTADGAYYIAADKETSVAKGADLDEDAVYIKKDGTVFTAGADEVADEDLYKVADLTAVTDDSADALSKAKLILSGNGEDAEKLNITGEDGGLKLQIGETSITSDKLNVKVMNFKTDELFADVAEFANADGDTAVDALTQANSHSENENGLTINISNQDSASMAAEAVREVIDKVSAQRASLGAMQNRLEHTIENLDVASENITAANSRIRDTDMAKEMMAYTQGNVLTQAAQAMLAQANQAPQGVLQLLQ